MFCACHFFCSQVFKTMSNVLNSDVNIALIAFCSLADVKFKVAKYEIRKTLKGLNKRQL